MLHPFFPSLAMKCNCSRFLGKLTLFLKLHYITFVYNNIGMSPQHVFCLSLSILKGWLKNWLLIFFKLKNALFFLFYEILQFHVLLDTRNMYSLVFLFCCNINLKWLVLFMLLSVSLMLLWFHIELLMEIFYGGREILY